MSGNLCEHCTSHDRGACEGVRQFATITASCSCGCHFAPQLGVTVALVSAADLAAERTRADAAEAEVARLREEHAAVYRQAAHDRELRVAAEEALATAREECDAAHGRSARWQDERDAARAEAAGLRAEHAELIECLLADRNALRAIVEGRTVAPTDAEIEHHWRMGGAWLVGRSVVTDRDEARRLASVGIAGVTWVALGGMLRGGTPCAWPTVTP